MTTATDARGSGQLSNGHFVALALFILIIFLAATIDPVMMTLEPQAGGISVADFAYINERGMLGRRIALPVLAAVASLWLGWRGIRSLRFQGPVGPLLMAALAWSVASVFWADEPTVAARKIGALICMWIGAFWIAALIPMKRMPTLTALTILVVVALCVGREAYDGWLRPFHAGYRFGGFFHPNDTAEYLAFGTFASFVLAVTSRSRALPVLCLAISASFLYLTRSRTSFFSVLVGLLASAVLAGFSSRRTAHRLALGAGVLIVVACAAYVVAGEHMGEGITNWILMGRDPSDFGTLTNRTTAWSELLVRFVSARPFTGFGYGAFWTVKHVAAMSLVVPGPVFLMSHSGYLELLLSVGIIGAALHVGYMLLATLSAIRQHIRSPDVGSAFAFGILAMLLTEMVAQIPNFEVSLTTFLTMTVIARFAIVHRHTPSPAVPRT